METITGAGETAGLAALLVLVGSFFKQVPGFPDRWIPTLLAMLGCGAALAIGGVTVENAVQGLSSGLAAVGANQLYRQHTVEPAASIQKPADTIPPTPQGKTP